MSIEELIEMVCRLYGRMDKVQDMKIAFSGFLREAHSLDFYRKDIKYSYVLNPSLVDGVLQINMSTELSALRRILAVRTYSSYAEANGVVFPGTPVRTQEPYHEGDANNLTNYYGVPDRFTWTIMGIGMQIRDISQEVTCVEILGIGYPTFGANILTGALETDSWIFREFPQLLEAYCRKWLCGYVKDPQLFNSANQNFYEKRTEFISAYTQEIISWR